MTQIAKAPDSSELPEASALPVLPSQRRGGTQETTPEPFSVNSSVPSIGAFMTEDHRYYWNGRGPYPSVTTILKVMDKPAVYQWAKRTVAEFAVGNLIELQNRVGVQGPEEAARWLASLPEYQRDTAGTLGSGIHLLADMYARASETEREGFEIAPEALPFIAGFKRFLEAHGGSEAIVSSEKAVLSLHDGYAGTFDLLMTMRCGSCEACSEEEELSCLEPELWLIDIKTSKGYYPEYGLQLSAYAHAEGIILKDDPKLYPLPPVDRVGILHLRPDQYPDTGYRLVEYPIENQDYLAFLAALELWQWKGKGRFTKSNLQKT